MDMPTFNSKVLLRLVNLKRQLNVIYEPEIKFCRSFDKSHIFGGLEVACWPLVPKFEGSNPAEAVGFFRTKKSSARLPSERK